MMTNAEAGRSAGSIRHPPAATRKAAPAANVVTISRRAKPYRSWALDCSTRASTLRSNRTRRSDRRDGFISGRIGCFKEALDRRWPRTGEASARVITHDVSVTILLVTLNVQRKALTVSPTRRGTRTSLALAGALLAAVCAAATAAPASAALGVSCPDPPSQPFAAWGDP